MKESITQAAADAVAPSQFMARLAGIMAAHGEDVEKLLALAAEAAIAEQDSRTFSQWLRGHRHAAYDQSMARRNRHAA